MKVLEEITEILESMAVAHPCYQQEWGEWNEGMVKNRRIRLWERLRRWLEVEVTNEEEEDGAEEEGEDGNSKGEDVSEEEEENEAGEKRGEGNKEIEAEENDKEDEEGESDLEKRLQERIKTKKNREMIEGDNQVGEERMWHFIYMHRLL